jgi:hypothetical protein
MSAFHRWLGPWSLWLDGACIVAGIGLPFVGLLISDSHAYYVLLDQDMSQHPPTQELMAKDLHGVDWSFRHIFRGDNHPSACTGFILKELVMEWQGIQFDSLSIPPDPP